MAGLTHEQARRRLHAAADKCLKPGDRPALDAHLAECRSCRAYAADLHWLNGAIARALRSRWPWRRSPADLAARVRNRVRTEAERRLFLGFAQAVARVGSLAVMAAFVVGLLQGTLIRLPTDGAPSTLTASALTSGYRYNLPQYELASDSEQAAFPAGMFGEADSTTDVPPNQMIVSQY